MTEKKKPLGVELQLHSERAEGRNSLDPIHYLYSKTKEVRITEDSFEAMRLIQTGKWAISIGFVRDGKVNWILNRFACDGSLNSRPGGTGVRHLPNQE